MSLNDKDVSRALASPDVRAKILLRLIHNRLEEGLDKMDAVRDMDHPYPKDYRISILLNTVEDCFELTQRAEDL